MKAMYMLAALTAVGLTLAPQIAAQDAEDPFADSSDPFGESNKGKDPFGDAADDPFAEPGRDPFAKAKPKDASDHQPDERNQRSERDDSRQQSPSEKNRIRPALDELTNQAFQDTPLTVAIRILSRYHQIPIVINSRALEEIGLSVEEPITIELDRVSLRCFLSLMLRGLDLTFMIDDEVLMITTQEAAENNLQVQVYRIHPDLVGQADDLIKAMQTTVQSSIWDAYGGPATAAPVAGKFIVVAATESWHEQVHDFLSKVSAALDAE